MGLLDGLIGGKIGYGAQPGGVTGGYGGMLGGGMNTGPMGNLSDILTGLGVGLLSQGPSTTPISSYAGIGQGLQYANQLGQQRRATGQQQFQNQLAQQSANQETQKFTMEKQRFDAQQQQETTQKAAISKWVQSQPADKQTLFQAFPDQAAKEYFDEQAQGLKPPTTRTIHDHGNTIDQQYDPGTKQWVNVGTSPQFAPQQPPASPEVMRLLVAAGIDPKSPQGQAAIAHALGTDKPTAGGVITGDDAKNLGLDPTGAYQRRPDGTFAVLTKPRSEGTFGGNALDAQDSNIILKGQSDEAFRSTPEYAMAWNRQYQQPKLQTTQDPSDPMKQIIQAVVVPPPVGFKAPGGAPVQPGGVAQPVANPAQPPVPTAMPIPGTDSQKQLSDEQKLSLGFTSRMSASNDIIGSNQNAGTSMRQAIKSDVPVIGNYLVSDSRQQLEQAERDFVNAQLRRESGAAISSQEFDNARKQYFPQPGDGPNVLEQKAANRQRVIDGMKQSASSYLLPTPPPPAGGPDLYSKYGLAPPTQNQAQP